MIFIAWVLAAILCFTFAGSALCGVAIGLRVDTDRCIEWDGRLSFGYAVTRAGGRQKRVHRLVWEEERGPIPEGLCVLHRCDNRACINIDHLFVGDRQDNAQDCAAKGRNTQQRKTHCPSGHRLEAANLVPWESRLGIRKCRACVQARDRLRGSSLYRRHLKEIAR